MNFVDALKVIVQNLPEIIKFIKKTAEWIETEQNKKWFSDKIEAFELLDRADELERTNPNEARKLRILGLRKLGNVTSRVR